jgi:RNA polymerase sigma-70 factor (ECF subfamily)
MTARTWDALVAGDVKVPAPAAAVPDADAARWEALDDAALVEACLGGHREAFGPIVQRYGPQVYRVCYRFAGNQADASELAQDALVRAYRGLRSFRGRSTLGTWLYRIAVNVCLNRTAVRAAPLEPLDREPPDNRAEAADAVLLRDERARRVRAAIARLPKTQRATLILRVYHDLGHEEIARVLGSSAGTVKVNFFHALANLRKMLR